ncbi:hypothetical protein FGU65_03805 [Methanoculleus sp. FWC-SCC1]|uniref:Uncharacterized protein n=1 Tax=Methanoculleus frigidifontis TaxID=2584085 RepID=A0ABT8M7W2_9EURY|nr:hypothetical protein [Methanoculleus sp. FWC-SCC1]MDN7024023.1 hypothetical protein [Methanoculleus sp. FWC-SCC1]
MSSVEEGEIFTQVSVVTSFRAMREGRLKEAMKEHPHDITAARGGLVGKELLMREGLGRSTFSYRPGHHPMGGEMFGAPGICSKSSSEHLPGSSEHLDTLHEIARPVGSVRKASRKAAYHSRKKRANVSEGRYARLVREGRR